MACHEPAEISLCTVPVKAISGVTPLRACGNPFVCCAGEGNPIQGIAPSGPVAVGVWRYECLGCTAGGVLAGPHAHMGLGSLCRQNCKHQRLSLTMLCCAVLCCPVLCRAVPWCGVLCCAVPWLLLSTALSINTTHGCCQY